MMLKWIAGFIFLPLTVYAQAPQERQIELDYTATFLGLPVGEGQVRSTILGAKYTTIAQGQVTGIGAAFSGGSAQVRGKGEIGKTRLHGASYGYEATHKGGPTQYKLEMVKDNVKSSVFTPEKPQIGEIMPLLEEHKRNIFDPIAATAIVVPEGLEKLSEAGCGKTQQLFDGKIRYDITMSYLGKETVALPGYQGEVVKCRLQMVALAGYRIDKPIMKENEKVPVVVWMMPISETRILLPFKIEAQTKFGLARLIATRVKF